MNATGISDDADSSSKLPAYAIVLIVLLILVILCGAAGIVYYLRIKNENHSDPRTTVDMDKPTSPQQPVTETNGRDSALYEDVGPPQSYEGLHMGMDESVVETKQKKNTPEYVNVSMFT